MEDLNPSGQTGEQPRAGPREETLWTDSILESLGAHRSMEESTTATDGVGGGERLATMEGDSVETSCKSSEVGVGAADVMPELVA